MNFIVICVRLRVLRDLFGIQRQFSRKTLARSSFSCSMDFLNILAREFEIFEKDALEYWCASYTMCISNLVVLLFCGWSWKGYLPQIFHRNEFHKWECICGLIVISSDKKMSESWSSKNPIAKGEAGNSFDSMNMEGHLRPMDIYIKRQFFMSKWVDAWYLIWV